MDKGQSVSVLWDYYQAAAEIQGRDKPNAAQNENEITQAGYSLLWAFQSRLEDLPPLMLAFLGDKTAMNELNWGAASPSGWEKFTLEGQPLNESQAEAVRLALTAPLSFIQGPPGTGKTETILNLASCAARMDGGRSVAIVSSNRDALKNIQEKIGSFADAAPNRRWLWAHYAPLGKSSIRENFREKHPGDPLCAFGRPGNGEISETDRRPANRERNIRAEDFLKKYPIISSTIHSLRNCFQDGNTYLYDYVIMDESSQTNTVAGLVAMGCARHLVLVGDPKQLPPVVPKTYVEQIDRVVRERGWAVPPEHLASEDRSFLDVCLDVFRGRTAQVVLRSHYRCHPGIIGFCAKEIYREEKLKICTPQWDTTVQTPIKVLWFEGNYCEKTKVRGKKKKTRKASEIGPVRFSKHNRKQTRCFMEEEWPALWERLQLPEEERPSVCILSPFLGQLESLEDAIRNDLAARKYQSGALKLSLEDGDANQASQDFKPPMLTIHKSQGHEYDIVYLLPAEDGDWEWPWSQKKRLVNVAVSRAKKELRLILSSALMDEDMQQTLTGRPILPKEQDPDPDKAQDERFLQKLVRYVREENEALEQKTGMVGYPASVYTYGFHRSARSSIFDLTPWERAILERKKAKANSEMNTSTSAPEVCVETALIELIRNYHKKGIFLSLYKHVMLRDLCFGNGQKPEPSQAVSDMMKNGGHLDFALCRGDRILLAIEVDGEFHRKPNEEGGKQRERDKIKDEFFRSLHASCLIGNCREGQEQALAQKSPLAFLRLRNDGSACLESLELWENADAEMKNRYFPLEELLEPRLHAADDAQAVCIPAKSISDLIQGWGDSFSGWCDANCDQLSRSRASNDELVRQGLLYGKGLEKKATKIPTASGQQKGIIEAIRIGINGQPYAYALYPCAIQKDIMDRLDRHYLMAEQDIETLLRKVYFGLKQHLEKKGSSEEQRKELLELSQKLSFVELENLDYHNVMTQAVYIMRYMYAYAYEYKLMYRKLLERVWSEREMALPERLSVTSIGCGNMVDYWALHAALQESAMGRTAVDYIGVDYSNWAEEFRIRKADGDTVQFIKEDAAIYLQDPAAQSAASDVYIFPKSIIEFCKKPKEQALERIRDGLRDVLRTSGKERVWVLISLPFSKECRINMKADRDNSARILEGIQEAGYVTEDRTDAFVTFNDLVENRSEDEKKKEQRISNEDKTFCYPNRHPFKIKNEFYEFTKLIEDDTTIEPDKKRKVRNPIYSPEYIQFQVLLFRRKE